MKYILVGRNLYTEQDAAVGTVYGIYNSIPSARNALADDIEKCTIGEDMCWDIEDIHEDRNNPLRTYAGDEYVWEIVEVEI